MNTNGKVADWLRVEIEDANRKMAELPDHRRQGLIAAGQRMNKTRRELSDFRRHTPSRCPMP